MAGLKLKLRPEEQILINGAVVQNGKHQVELTVKTQNTRILRLRDAIHPNDANTPVKRICYIAQLAVAGEVSDEAAQTDFVKGATALLDVFRDDAVRTVINDAITQAKAMNFYKAMQTARKLIPHEEALTALFAGAEAPSQKIAADMTATLTALKDQLVGEKAEKFSGAGRNAPVEEGNFPIVERKRANE